jgi:hypothetical protein
MLAYIGLIVGLLAYILWPKNAKPSIGVWTINHRCRSFGIGLSHDIWDIGKTTLMLYVHLWWFGIEFTLAY